MNHCQLARHATMKTVLCTTQESLIWPIRFSAHKPGYRTTRADTSRGRSQSRSQFRAERRCGHSFRMSMMIVEPCGGSIVRQTGIWNTVRKRSFTYMRRLDETGRQRKSTPWHTLQHLQHAHAVQSLGHVGVNKVSIEGSALSEHDTNLTMLSCACPSASARVTNELSGQTLRLLSARRASLCQRHGRPACTHARPAGHRGSTTATFAVEEPCPMIHHYK